MNKNREESSNLIERNYIYALKFFAIISIVSAHCATVASDTSEINKLFSWILIQVGSVGVGVFFIISGYLFHRNKRSFAVFFKRRITTILIPWIVTGTGVYLYVVIRKDGIDLKEWANFLLGNGSYLYYLTLLMFFYMVFFFVIKRKLFIYSTIFMSVISIVLTALGLIDGINNYLNPLNFIGYFSVGLLIASNNKLKIIANRCSYFKELLLLLYILSLFLVDYLGLTAGYWGVATLIVQPIAILLVFGLASMKFVYNEKILLVGMESFAIYLLHMPVAGLVTYVFNYYDLWILTLARPFIIVAITMGFIYLYKRIGEKFKVDNFSNTLIGTRNN